MAEAGPSIPRNSRDESKTKQKKKHWLAPGGRGGGRGGRGGGGRGRGGGRGGAAGGPNWMNDNGERKITHLGRYREDPPMMSGPGILVMAIQNKERSAEKELILHLEDVVDLLYPETREGNDDGGAEGDFEDMLQKELEGMGQQNKSTRFKLCLHDTMCLFYINVLPPLDPVRICHHIMTTIEQTGQSPFKYIARIVPISVVGGATLPQLSTAAKAVVAPGFATDDDRHLKFAVQTWSRKTDRLDRLDMIRKVAEEVEALGKGHTVDLSHPDRTIVVEVFKNSIGVAVLQDFDRFKKYNPGAVAAAATKRIHGLSKPQDATAETPHASSATSPPTAAMQISDVPMSPPQLDPKPKDPPSTGKLPKHYHRKLNAAMANAEYQVAQNLSKRKVDDATAPGVGEDEAMEEIIEDGKVYKLART